MPRRISRLAAVAAVVWTVTAALPARAATMGVAKVSAKVAKPLTLTRVQDLDLGSLVLGPGTWTGATVRISRAGVFSCAANVTCTGATQVAQYNLTGSNNQAIRVTAPNVTLINQNDTTKTLLLEVDAPATVTVPNSGNKGVTFAIGGAITVSSDTADGVYSGTFDVTVDY